MPETTKPQVSALRKAFNINVTEIIGNDKAHGWSGDDSAKVIEGLIAEEMPEGKVPSDELMTLIKKVINPSAFRQFLEGQKRPDGSPVLIKKDVKKAEKEVASLYAGIE